MRSRGNWGVRGIGLSGLSVCVSVFRGICDEWCRAADATSIQVGYYSKTKVIKALTKYTCQNYLIRAVPIS